MSGSSSNDTDPENAGPPLPDFRSAGGIQLQTVAPALGVPTPIGGGGTPDYLQYDPKGRGIMVTMFANSGLAYLIGIGGGGLYGVAHGLRTTPSTRWRVQLNSVLNNSGRYGSRAGNAFGVFAVLYSLYEGIADQMELDYRLGWTGPNSMVPASVSYALPATVGSVGAAATYFAPSGPRAAGLAGVLGMGAVVVTYTVYNLAGVPYGSRGFLFL